MTGKRIAFLAAGFAVLAVAAGAAVAIASGSPSNTAARVLAAIDGATHLGAAAWLAVAAVQIAVSVSGLLPASMVGIVAGSMFGIGPGFALSSAGLLAGAGLAFALSRGVLRPWVERLMRGRPRLHRIDAAIQQQGWRLACLLRLSPVMPFAATSYMLGLSSIHFRDYCIGTLGSLPALFGYVAIGALAGASMHAWGSDAGLIRLFVLGVGLVATMLVTLKIGGIVAGALGKGATFEANLNGECPLQPVSRS
jgi:uncharacterized membrane protein YdjX (TVP38/TMEM64 family)